MPQASTVVFDAADVEQVAISADHLSMIKLVFHKDGYEKVSRHLQLLTEEASDVISAR